MSGLFALQTADGTRMQVRRWLPDGPPKAIVLVAHGMAEHAGRYDGYSQLAVVPWLVKRCCRARWALRSRIRAW